MHYVFAFFGILLSVSTHVAANSETGASISELRNMDQNSAISRNPQWDAGDSEVDLRYSAMRDAALSVGAQNGYLARTKALKAAIEKQATSLDAIFDFGALMRLATDTDVEMFLLPPVIEETHGAVSVSDDYQQIKISGRIYRIYREERLVSSPPNWREYLIFDEGVEVNQPHFELLPKTKKEKALWSEFVTQGWAAGSLQAEREILSRVRLLGRDFIGTIRYMELVLAGKITRPTITSSHHDVIGGGSVMREDEKLYQVTTPAELNSNVDHWRPLPMDTRGSLRYPVEVSSDVPK